MDAIPEHSASERKKIAEGADAPAPRNPAAETPAAFFEGSGEPAPQSGVIPASRRTCSSAARRRKSRAEGKARQAEARTPAVARAAAVATQLRVCGRPVVTPAVLTGSVGSIQDVKAATLDKVHVSVPILVVEVRGLARDDGLLLVFSGSSTHRCW